MNKKVLAVIAVFIGLNIGTVIVGMIADGTGHHMQVDHSHAYYECLSQSQRYTDSRAFMTRMCYQEKARELSKKKHSHTPGIVMLEHPAVFGWLSIAAVGILSLIKLEEAPKPKAGKLAELADKQEGKC